MYVAYAGNGSAGTASTGIDMLAQERPDSRLAHDDNARENLHRNDTLAELHLQLVCN